MANLLSGLFGALLATALGAVFVFWVERIKVKAEVMLTVVGWADETYLRLCDLRMAKEAHYADGKPYLEPGEYERNSRELRALLLRNSVVARVALVYGDGQEVGLLDELRGSLLSATRKIWGARRETWVDVNREVLAMFETQIDPLRHRLERAFLEGGSFPMRWLGIRKRLMKGPQWGAAE